MIREATSDDAPGIFEVIETTWIGESAHKRYIQYALAQPDHRCVVYTDDRHQVVGFVDAFLTQSSSGYKRWEVDLLAVLPGYQGQGIAKQLVEAATRAGMDAGADVARALVRVDNTPAQRTFASCGYRSDRIVYKLLVSSSGGGESEMLPLQADLIPVDTFTYRGIWLEGEEISQDRLVAAQNACVSQNRDVAGVVIPDKNMPEVEAALNAGYDSVGDFHWWTFDFRR